jgi:hypothetical protein
MATQTRRTTQRSARFLRATLKAHVVVACCGLVLWSAVAAHAATAANGMPSNGLPCNGLELNGYPVNGVPFNGIPWNGIPIQGMPIQGMPYNGTPLNGFPATEGSLPTAPSERLPWSTLSHQGVGKHQPPYCNGTLCRP